MSVRWEHRTHPLYGDVVALSGQGDVPFARPTEDLHGIVVDTADAGALLPPRVTWIPTPDALAEVDEDSLVAWRSPKTGEPRVGTAKAALRSILVTYPVALMASGDIVRDTGFEDEL